MSEQVTLRGFVGKDPERRMFDDGTNVAWFRLATTSRRFDAATNTWHDGTTNWYTIRCFRSLALHVLASVRCGQPVLVTGKLGINEWTSESGPRTEVRVDATSIGHDLAFGTANFARTGGRSQRTGSQEAATERSPEDGEGEAREDGDARNRPGDDGERYRSARSLGLGEEGVVDVASGAVLSMDGDDDTFDGLQEAQTQSPEESEEERQPVGAGAR